MRKKSHCWYSTHQEVHKFQGGIIMNKIFNFGIIPDVVNAVNKVKAAKSTATPAPVKKENDTVANIIGTTAVIVSLLKSLKDKK
jgi:hypothetical protein